MLGFRTGLLSLAAQLALEKISLNACMARRTSGERLRGHSGGRPAHKRAVLAHTSHPNLPQRYSYTHTTNGRQRQTAPSVPGSCSTISVKSCGAGQACEVLLQEHAGFVGAAAGRTLSGAIMISPFLVRTRKKVRSLVGSRSRTFAGVGARSGKAEASRIHWARLTMDLDLDESEERRAAYCGGRGGREQ